jgi:hypothetical protein
MHRWQFHAQWEQHARRSSMFGGAAFSGAHSMPRESSIPREAASFRGTQHGHARVATCPGKQYAQGDTPCRGGAAFPEKQHAQGDTSCWGSSMPGEAAFSGGAACPEKQHAQGGSIKALCIAHLQFHVKVLCAAPPGMQLPLRPRYAVP